MDTPPESSGSDDIVFGPEELEAIRRRLRSLTTRQHEVLTLLGDGQRPAEIARVLHISKNTVGFHLNRVRRKLGVASRAELLVRAVLLRRSAENGKPLRPRG